jgi:uncharacterized protein (TIGR03545 family)
MMRWIRWKGLAAFIAIVAALALVWLVLVDWVARTAIEAAGTRAVGAKVDVADADVSLFPAGIALTGIAITDPDQPMTNRVEMQHVVATLELPALIQRNVIIDDLRIEGVRFHTPRKRSGAIAPTGKQPASGENPSDAKPSWLTDLCGTDNLPLISLPSANDILTREPLQSVEQIKKTETRIEAAAADWEKKLKALPNEKSIAEYQTRAKKIKGSAGGLGALLGSATEAQALYKDLQKDLKRIDKARTEFKTEYNALKTDVSDLRKLPEAEIKRLMDKYRFTSAGAANWSRLLFGHNLCGWWQNVYRWYKRINPYLSRLPAVERSPQADRPMRGKGLNVRFQERHPMPDLLIRRVYMDAKLDTGDFTGQLSDITSHPRIVGKPLTFKFLGRNLQQVQSLNLIGTLNFIQPQSPQHTAKLDVQGYRIRDMLIGAQALDLSIKKASADFTLDFSLKGAHTDTRLAAKLGRLQFAKSKAASSEVATVVTDALSKARTIGLTASIKGNAPDYRTTLQSDLEGVLRNAAGSLVKRESDKLTRQLSSEVGARLTPSIDKIQSQMTQLDNIDGELLKRSRLGKKVLEQLKLPI